MTQAPPSMPDPNVRHRRPPVSALAIISMVSGIAALFTICGGVCCMFIWPLVPIGGVAAVTCGHVALVRIKRQRATGRGMAIAGVSMGYAALACCLAIVGLIVIEALWPGTIEGSFTHFGTFP